IKNAFREGVAEMVNNLTKIGKLHIITGDNEGDKERLLKIFPIGTIMNFNLTPDDKLQYVQQLENKGSHVLMIGDGLNDAGALRASTMGVSVADDIYNFSPASDAILQADSLQLLPTVHKLSRKTMRFIKISLG
ncbi:MAG TPA: HAD-IC family P-type ATPase, partial [Bacteroidales bacterium]|nr:HAD-IC family P-type ATPase [Bacteroidales bacterium]